jgi:hypothetical protein
MERLSALLLWTTTPMGRAVVAVGLLVSVEAAKRLLPESWKAGKPRKIALTFLVALVPAAAAWGSGQAIGDVALMAGASMLSAAGLYEWTGVLAGRKSGETMLQLLTRLTFEKSDKKES